MGLSADLKTAIVRGLYPYGSTRRVLFGPLRRARYIVTDGMGVSYALGRAQHVPRAAEYIRDGMTVLDVGANVGQFTLLAAAMVGDRGRVVALEPVPRLYATLVRNIALNSLTQVEALNVAAAAQSGRAEFRFADLHPTQGRLEGVEPHYDLSDSHTIDVETDTLDEICQGLGCSPDVIKIDVEGGARSVFDGATHVLGRARPNIYIELHGPDEQSAVGDCLQARGYTLRNMAGDTISDPTAEWISPLWARWVGQ